MITLNALEIGYQGKSITPPLNGTFHAGTLTALVGANGTGKSTLLKTLAGLVPPVSGSVELAVSRKQMAWLPQHSEIDKTFPITVFDLVAMGYWQVCGWFGGINRAMRQNIMAALAQVGMEAFATAQPGSLSGGQLQRVLFARLLLQDAPLLLLDEPFTGVDSATEKLLIEHLKARHRAGCTLIVVLHDMATVAAHFQQSLCLSCAHAEWHGLAHSVSAASMSVVT